MKALPRTDRNSPDRRWPILASTVVIGPLLYGIGLWAAGTVDGSTAAETVCFDPAVADHLAVARIGIAIAMAMGASLLLAAPWVLGTVILTGNPSRADTAGAWSLAVNSIALIVVGLLLRNTAGIHRPSFLAAWLAWTGLLLWQAGKRPISVAQLRNAAKRYGPTMAVGLAAVVLGISLFAREQFLQCFNGDGVETFELARSLRGHLLPYWEIETTGQFGTVIVNPSLVNSYWTLACQLLLGENELATRLPFWVWWLGVFAAAVSIVSSSTRHTTSSTQHSAFSTQAWLPAVPLALFVVLAGLWYTFYVGYYPYMTDTANPGVPDGLFTLLLLLALDCLRRRDLPGWIVMTALASLVLYAGPVMFLLTAAAGLIWQPVPRKAMLRASLAGVAVLGGLGLFYIASGWFDGSLSGWASTLWKEYFKEFVPPQMPWRPAGLFAGYFLLGCGGVAALGLVRAFRRRPTRREAGDETAWQRTVATMTLAYLAIVLGAAYKNLHYLGPLLPVTLILWLQTARPRGGQLIRQWLICGSAAAGLLISIGLCWPASRDAFTRNRQLGALTTFQTNSHEEACRWGRIAWKLYADEHFGWLIGRHTWVHYSRLDQRQRPARPLVVTDRTLPPPQYRLVCESDRGIRLYSQDPDRTRWAADRQRPPGMDRWPRVFRSIAIRPRSRDLPEP